MNLSLKKANVVAGEPIVVCADAHMPPSHLWARTRTQGRVSWISVEITDAKGRAVPAITYKQVAFKNAGSSNYELHRPNAELHLEYVVPKSKKLIVPGEYTVHVESQLPYAPTVNDPKGDAVAERSAEFALHVAAYDGDYLQKQAEAYYQMAIAPATPLSSDLREAMTPRNAIDALFALPDFEARPVWLKLLRKDNLRNVSAVWENVMRVATDPRLKEELKTLYSARSIGDEERASLANYIKRIDNYNAILRAGGQIDFTPPWITNVAE